MQELLTFHPLVQIRDQHETELCFPVGEQASRELPTVAPCEPTSDIGGNLFAKTDDHSRKSVLYLLKRKLRICDHLLCAKTRAGF